MPGADDLMMRIYAAMAQNERELISERAHAAPAAAKTRGRVLGGDRGYRPPNPPDARLAARIRVEGADQTTHRIMLELQVLRAAGIMSFLGLARALNDRAIPTPRGKSLWTHTTVNRLQMRAGA